ncbi:MULTISPECIES: ribosomal-processing cysteine protease Prp [unclassified Spiroplasma]|uniref:ribosomal-processing cysteine protease Prp n=1 Tax=unclassified Spiroplasma TaxID=2637901 RepID=UPI0030D37A5D
MVRVQIQRQQNNYYQVIVSGHSGFKAKGQDIVCSAISAVVFGTLNALDRQCQDSISISVKDDIIIKVLEVEAVNQIVLNTMVYQLQTIAEQYPQNIEIKEI